MKTVEPHLAADAIAFLDHRQNSSFDCGQQLASP
jgi:hypothetical protein